MPTPPPPILNGKIREKVWLEKHEMTLRTTLEMGCPSPFPSTFVFLLSFKTIATPYDYTHVIPLLLLLIHFANNQDFVLSLISISAYKSCLYILLNRYDIYFCFIFF